MSGVIDYNELKIQITKGINQYLNNDFKAGDRYGLHHGKKGKLRAKRTLSYINSLDGNNYLEIIALLYSIFRPDEWSFFGWLPGRSSGLASLIADSIISGESTAGTIAAHRNTLSSSSFIKKELREFSENHYYFRTISNGELSFSYFDKTKGLRGLLRKVINELNSHDRKEVYRFSKEIRQNLENPTEQKKLEMQDLDPQNIGRPLSNL